MSFTYQQLSTYSGNLYGEPRAQGIEYDWEVPMNQVVASPGGVSDIQHHWTGGMYGRGNTSSDIYAGQGYRYPSAMFGSLYRSGHKTGQDYPTMYTEAPDHQYWKNEEPQQYSYSQTQADLKGSSLLDVPNMEGYEKVDLADTDKVSVVPGDQYQSSVKTQGGKWLLFIVLIFAVVVAFFWSESIKGFISQVVYNGKRFHTISWPQLVLISALITSVFAFTYWIVFD